MKPTIEIRDTIMDQAAAIGRAWEQSKEKMLECAEMVAKFCDATPDWIEKVLPHFSKLGYGPKRSDLIRLEKIGRGEILLEVVLGDGDGFAYLEKVSPSLQKKFLAEPFQLAVIGEQGKPTIMRIEVGHLKKQQCEQLFAPDRTVRTIDQQIEYLKTVKQPTAMPLFMDKGDAVLCTRAFKVSKKELPGIIEQLKKLL